MTPSDFPKPGSGTALPADPPTTFTLLCAKCGKAIDLQLRGEVVLVSDGVDYFHTGCYYNPVGFGPPASAVALPAESQPDASVVRLIVGDMEETAKTLLRRVPLYPSVLGSELVSDIKDFFRSCPSTPNPMRVVPAAAVSDPEAT